MCLCVCVCVCVCVFGVLFWANGGCVMMSAVSSCMVSLVLVLFGVDRRFKHKQKWIEDLSTKCVA